MMFRFWWNVSGFICTLVVNGLGYVVLSDEKKEALFVRQQSPLSKANIMALRIWSVALIIFCLLIADISLD